MKTSKLITASCIAGGLLGVGIITYLLWKEDEITKTAGVKNKSKSKPAKKTPTVKAHKSYKEKKVVAPVEKVPVSIPPIDKKPIDTKPDPVTISESAPLQDEFPLRLGSMGNRVERLKVFLMRNYGMFGKIDQYFDTQTAALLQKHLGVSQLDQATYNQYKMGNHVTEQLIIR